MISLDYTFTLFINQFVHKFYIFDRVILEIAENHLLKGGVILTLMMWALFSDKRSFDKKNIFLVSTFIASLFSMLICRMIAICGPYRDRPMHEPSLHLNLPYDMGQYYLDHWSSFPSDHAALFFALSTCIYLTYNKIGKVALIYTSLFIAFPRLYLGFHYPTDILVGACLGVLSSVLVFSFLRHTKLMNKITGYGVSKPEIFYPFFILYYSQVLDMFENARRLPILISDILHVIHLAVS